MRLEKGKMRSKRTYLLEWLNAYYFDSALHPLKIKGKMKITFGFLLLWLSSESQGYLGPLRPAGLVLPTHNRSCSRWSRISPSSVVLPLGSKAIIFFWPCKGKWFQISWVLCGISHLCCSSAALSAFQSQSDLLWGAKWLAGSGAQFHKL